MPSIIQLLDTANAAVQNAVTPGGRPFLVTGIVLVGANVILIGRCKGDGSFDEAAESETGVLASRCQELVAVKKFGEIVLADGVDNDVSWYRIDAIIEIAVQDTDLVVHNHRSVSATRKLVNPSGETVLWRKSLCFENRGNVIVTIGRLCLTRGQVAVNKAQ